PDSSCSISNSSSIRSAKRALQACQGSQSLSGSSSAHKRPYLGSQSASPPPVAAAAAAAAAAVSEVMTSNTAAAAAAAAAAYYGVQQYPTTAACQPYAVDPS